MARIRTIKLDDRPRDARGHFKKSAIPVSVRMEVAANNGGIPLQITDAKCVYCGAPGRIGWVTKSWVWLDGLEFDHVVPEYHGGQTVASNLVLACRACNRRKGHRNA